MFSTDMTFLKCQFSAKTFESYISFQAVSSVAHQIFSYMNSTYLIL